MLISGHIVIIEVLLGMSQPLSLASKRMKA